jgi:NAD(P)-dependent dehydrogenase (short-subunit alcohol dehydrogenase family)
MEIKDSVVIITGAGSGIGRAMALAFAREGARVVCCGRRYANLDETVNIIDQDGGYALALAVDVTRREQIQKVVKAVIQKWGCVNILINNAARFGALGAAWEVDWQEWVADVDVNLKGPFQFCQVVLPYMIENGKGIIVNITAQAGTTAKPGCSGYGASKAALMHMTNTLALELSMRRLPIVVFGLDPGFNRTDMTVALGEMEECQEWLPGLKQRVSNPAGDEPSRVAATAVELARYGTPLLSGRVFRVGMTVDFIQEHADEIQSDDLLTLRFRHLG